MMKSDSQVVYDDMFSCLSQLRSTGVVGPNKGKQSTFHNKMRRWSEDECSEALCALFDAASVARERGYPIPKELSYFMIDYFTKRFEKDSNGDPREEPIEFKRAFAFDRENREEPIRDIIHFQMEFDAIASGYLEGVSAVASKQELEYAEKEIYRYSFKHFELGDFDELRLLLSSELLKAKEYGRLLGVRSQKLKVQDVTAFFNVCSMAMEYQTNPKFQAAFDEGEDCSKRTYVNNALKTYNIKPRIDKFIDEQSK